MAEVWSKVVSPKGQPGGWLSWRSGFFRDQDRCRGKRPAGPDNSLHSCTEVTKRRPAHSSCAPFWPPITPFFSQIYIYIYLYMKEREREREKNLFFLSISPSPFYFSFLPLSLYSGCRGKEPTNTAIKRTPVSVWKCYQTTPTPPPTPQVGVYSQPLDN